MALFRDRRIYVSVQETLSPDPTSCWAAQQIREAFPWDTAPKYMIRDRDSIYGSSFKQSIKNMGIKEVLTAPGSPWQNAYLARFRAIVKRYPMKEKTEILSDLIASTPGEEGKWFAAAKDAGCFDLAIDLVNKSFCDPKTLNRAAMNFKEENPKFALGAALASLRWIAKGYGYEITGKEVLEAYTTALLAAKSLNSIAQVNSEIQEITTWGNPKNNFVYQVLDKIDATEKHHQV
jgi:transposase InsO family protein